MVSNGEPAQAEFRARVGSGRDAGLAVQPLRKFGEPVGKGNLGLIAQDAAREADVSEAVTDVTGAVLLGDPRLEVLPAKHPRDLIRDLANRVVPAAAEIENTARSSGRLQREAA